MVLALIFNEDVWVLKFPDSWVPQWSNNNNKNYARVSGSLVLSMWQSSSALFYEDFSTHTDVSCGTEGTHTLFCLQKAPASTDEGSIPPPQLHAGGNFIPAYLKTTHPLFSQETIYVLPKQRAVFVSTSIINKLIFWRCALVKDPSHTKLFLKEVFARLSWLSKCVNRESLYHLYI